MNRQGRWFLLLGISLFFLQGCVGQMWSGAMMAYDRHTLYEKLDDYQLSAEVNRALFHDETFKKPGVVIDVAVFNNDLLLTGHVPTQALRDLAIARIKPIGGYRDFYNQLAVNQTHDNTVQDSLITMQIRAKIFADSSIDPRAFKIVTADRIVYIMGEAKPTQAQIVLTMASHTAGVRRVVKLLKYHLTSRTPDNDTKGA